MGSRIPFSLSPFSLRLVLDYLWPGSPFSKHVAQNGGGGAASAKTVNSYPPPRAKLEEGRSAEITQRCLHFEDPRADVEGGVLGKTVALCRHPWRNGGGAVSRTRRTITQTWGPPAHRAKPFGFRRVNPIGWAPSGRSSRLDMVGWVQSDESNQLCPIGSA